jgi:tetratricopeptide (TPR) repeat protein
MQRTMKASGMRTAMALVLSLCLGLILISGCGSSPSTPSPDAQARIKAARDALDAKDLAKALSEAQAAVQIDPNSGEAYFVLGKVYSQSAMSEANAQRQQQLLNSAIDAYRNALRLSPNNDAAHTNLGTVYYQLGRFDDAKAEAEAALKINPSDATTHYLLGTIYLQRDPGREPDALNKAQQEFETAVKSDPRISAAYVGLANVYLFKGDAAKALEHASKGVELLQPDADPFTYWALAQAQCATGDAANGAKTISTIKGMRPSDPQFTAQLLALEAKCK